MTRRCKTTADLCNDIRTQHNLAPAEQAALVRAGLRAPNMREFTLNSPYAWALFRPEPSLLPDFPRHRHNPIERDKD